MRTMKICYLANAHSIHVKRWVHYFVEKGHEVHVVSLVLSDTGGGKIHVLERSGIRLKVLSYAVDMARMFFRTRKLLKEINPDIVHSHYVWDYGVLGALTRFRPFVMSVWGSDVLILPRRSRFYKAVVAATLKRADMVTTTAVFMGAYLQEEFGLPQSKIMRVPWGVDLHLFCRGYEAEVRALKRELNIPAGAPVILSNRNMKPRYNIGNIVEAAYIVVLKHPETIFIMLRGYGDAEFEEEMKEKARTLGISANFRFIPRVLVPEEMAVFLNAADLFVSIPRTDQFASTIMEGMACGLIPVVTNMEVYRQYLRDGENAFLVDPDNPQEIAEKIIYSIEHPLMKGKVYEINRNIIEEKEDWMKNAQKMEELYERLVERMP